MFEEWSESAEDVLGRALPYVPPPAAVAPRVLAPPLVTAAASVDTAVPLSAPVQGLLVAVEQVVAQLPAELPGPQALADAAALLSTAEQLHAAVLGRVADVDARRLHTLDGAPSTGSWIAQQQTSLDRGEVALARRLSGMPLLQEAVRSGALSVAVAERVGKALARLRPHVDRPDGLIDGQPADEVLVGVIGHGVRDLICQGLGGLEDEDPRLAELLAALARLVESPGSELRRFEAAFVLLAGQLEPHALPDALRTLTAACLPNELEKQAADGHANRGFGLRLNADGSGWHITDRDLDLETGELLNTVLQAQLAVDEDAPTDTAEYDRLRQRAGRPGTRCRRIRAGAPARGHCGRSGTTPSRPHCAGCWTAASSG